MSFIGTNSWAAPRLKDAALSAEKLGGLYVEVRNLDYLLLSAFYSKRDRKGKEGVEKDQTPKGFGFRFPSLVLFNVRHTRKGEEKEEKTREKRQERKDEHVFRVFAFPQSVGGIATHKRQEKQKKGKERMNHKKVLGVLAITPDGPLSAGGGH